MTELKKASVKNKVEAVIFSAGHNMSLDEISKLCRSRKEEVIASLQELKKEYDEKQSSLMLVEEGDSWKFTVRDTYMPIVRKIVTETELTRSVLETLAVIAFKYPILQSELIKIRTNKAYDHLAELENARYITRQKSGRSNLIKLTDKFFKYFDLTEEKLKDKFKDFESIAIAIKEKEQEADKIKEDMHKKAEELKMQDEKIKEEIELLDKSEERFEVPLETYDSKIEKEKIGELEIIEEKNENTAAPMRAKEHHHIQKHRQPDAHEVQKANENAQEPQEKRKSRGIRLSPQMQANVNQKVEDMLHGGKENNDEKKEENREL